MTVVVAKMWNLKAVKVWIDEKYFAPYLRMFGKKIILLNLSEAFKNIAA